MVTFLRQRYSFQEGDTWEFEVKGTTHAGTLRINGPTVYFAHTQDSQVASMSLHALPLLPATCGCSECVG
jgi:hypothetical protein